MNGTKCRDFTAGILEQIFTENGMEEDQVEISDDVFEDVHRLIANKCQRLSELIDEKTKLLPVCKQGKSEVLWKETHDFEEKRPVEKCMSENKEEERVESEQAGSEDASYDSSNDKVSNLTDDGDVVNGRFTQLHFTLLKRNSKYHCSECYFKTADYKEMHSHFKIYHKEEFEKGYSILSAKSHKVSAMNGVTKLLKCTLCKFATFNLRGFKIHSKSVHNSNTETVQYLPATHHKALEEYQNYLASVKVGTQRKNAVEQFIAHFPLCDLNIGLDRHCVPKEASHYYIPCMRCHDNFLYPSLLEKHYAETHSTCGPRRSKTDHLYRCDGCTFQTASYKSIHKHFVGKHGYLGNFKTFSSVFDSDGSLDEGNSFKKSIVSDPSPLPKGHSHTVKSPEQSEKVKVVGTRRSVADKRPEYLLQCDKCKFQAQTVHALLNHYRGSHNRNYPEFAEDRIIDEFRQNVVLVEIPRKDCGADWSNGWINANCTALIKEPVYTCSYCTYTSTVFNTVASHYSQYHPKASCSKSTVGVCEKQSADEEESNTAYISLHRELFKCRFCKFSACLYQTMHSHYKSAHQDLVTTKTNFELLVHSSTTNWCFKCTKTFDKVEDLIEHIGKMHVNDVVNFARLSNGAFQCKFCNKSFSELSDLVEHLEEHESEYNEYYNKNYLVAFCCSKCRRVFKAKRFIRHHYTRMHTEWTDNSFTMDDIPKHFFVHPNNPKKQVDANKKSSNNSHLQEKKTDPHQLKPLPKSVFSVVRIDQNSYICRRCQFAAPHINTVKDHLKSIHNVCILPEEQVSEVSIKTMGKKLISNCSHTRWINRNPKMFEQHVKQRHHSSGSYDCPNCDRTFVCQVILIMHMRKKHKSSPLAEYKEHVDLCTKCSNTNRIRRDPLTYKRHVALNHAKGDYFRCPKCTKAYVCRSLFALHLKRHHDIKYSAWLQQNSKGTRQGKKANNEVEDPACKTTLKVSNLGKQLPISKNKKKDRYRDYSHPQSVKLINNEWKCFYCKTVFNKYITLRLHVVRDHPENEIYKCRWCDFTCKRKEKFKKHQKIHSRFIQARMAELRTLWKRQKKNGLRSKNKGLKLKLSEARQSSDDVVPVGSGYEDWGEQPPDETDLNTPPSDDLSPSYTNTTPVQKARKSIKSTSVRAKNQLDASSDSSEDDKLSEAFAVAPDGRMICVLCSYATVDRSRILFHLRSCHSDSSSLSCRLCDFTSHEYEEIKAHLVDHHKLEKNHHLAIDFKVEMNKEDRDRLIKIRKSNGTFTSRIIRRREFEPQPSLPILNFERGNKRKHDEAEDVIYPETSTSRRNTEPVYCESSSKRTTRPGNRMNGRSQESSRFTCKYCGSELDSTYEAEYHMRRHEIGMIESQSCHVEPQIFAKLCTFAP